MCSGLLFCQHCFCTSTAEPLNGPTGQSKIVCFLMPAGLDVCAMPTALALVQKVDPAGSRTVGVLTKVDCPAVPGDMRKHILNTTGAQGYPLKNGYFAVTPIAHCIAVNDYFACELLRLLYHCLISIKSASFPHASPLVLLCIAYWPYVQFLSFCDGLWVQVCTMWLPSWRNACIFSIKGSTGSAGHELQLWGKLWGGRYVRC